MTQFENLFIDKKFEITLSLVRFLSSVSLCTVSSSHGVDKVSKIFTLLRYLICHSFIRMSRESHEALNIMFLLGGFT